MKYIRLLVAAAIILGVGSAFAVGPDYEKGNGLSHTTSCTPPLTRAPNAEGVQVPITEAELDHADVSLYFGGDLFTAGTLVSGPIQTDIRCGHSWAIDTLQTGQHYVFATITDTDGRESEISLEGGPFSLSLPIMPPSAPTGLK